MVRQATTKVTKSLFSSGNEGIGLTKLVNFWPIWCCYQGITSRWKPLRRGGKADSPPDYNGSPATESMAPFAGKAMGMYRVLKGLAPILSQKPKP